MNSKTGGTEHTTNFQHAQRDHVKHIIIDTYCVIIVIQASPPPGAKREAQVVWAAAACPRNRAVYKVA